MKLKLPYGFSLYLWESEVQRVQIIDSHIIIKTCSGKNLTIELPATLNQNCCLKQEPIPDPKQILPPPIISPLPIQADVSPCRIVESLNNPYGTNLKDLKLAQAEIQNKLEDFRMQFSNMDMRIQDLEMEINDTFYLEETMRSEKGIEVLKKTYEALLPKVEVESKPEKIRKKKKS